MEPPARSLFTFISSELSETAAQQSKQSIKVSNDTKRMAGGADNRTSSSTNKTSDKIPENSSYATDNALNSVQQSRPNSQDVQARPYSALDNRRALAGSKLIKQYPSSGSLLEKRDSAKRTALDDGPVCCCTSYPTRSTGELEKRVDEMIDYGIQNLNEAGKALTNLGDNFEHDLKLMFMDIMTRVQHWVSIVQNRIYAARADLEAIRKESIARVARVSAKDLELIEMHRKLAEAEANLAMQDVRNRQRVDDAGNIARLERVSTSVQTAPEKDRVEEKDELQRGSAVTFVNTECQSGEDREKAKLEEELAQVLEENERMVKEHGDWENAIHCALLKGVSSLNVETLKVLRYPPVPCCGSCRFSSSRSNSPESVVACRSRTTWCDATPPSVERRSGTAPKSGKNNKIQSKRDGTDTSCCQPFSQHLLNCSRDNERSSENGMVLFLHQGDTGNLCQPCALPLHCPSGNIGNRGSVCVGGKCRKLATTGVKDKVSSAIRSPRSRPIDIGDLCVRNKDDTGENSTAKKNTVATKRCGACIRNRRNRDE